MTEPPKYPAAVTEAVARGLCALDNECEARLVADGMVAPGGQLVYDEWRDEFGAEAIAALDALAAMSPEDRAELIEFLGGDKAIEAATVQRIVAWLRTGQLVQQPSGARERVAYVGAADLIERQFGARAGCDGTQTGSPAQ